MRKIAAMLMFCITFAVSTLCSARALPNSEFSLGGLCVGTGCTLDYAISIYGEPEYVSSNGYGVTYRYGDSVILKGWKRTDGTVHINYVSVRAANGWGTPAGLTVGMKKSVATDLYGYESSRYDRSTGFYRTLYPHMGSGSGAGMFVYTNGHDVIKRIDVIN